MFGSDITTADITIEPDDGGGYSHYRSPAINIVVAGEGTIRIDNELSGASVGQLLFADGTTLDYADLLQILETPAVGRQAIGGDFGPNTLDSQGLVHEVVGNGGGDTIKYDRGYGALNIIENDVSVTPNNVLTFAAGIDPTDVAVTLSYAGKFMLDLGDGDVVSFAAPQIDAGSGIEAVQFADGTTWDSAQLLQIVDTGAPGKTFIQGTTLDERFDGRGFTHYIAGAGGSDTYVFNRGDGAETIYDSRYYSSDMNTIEFGANIAPADVTVSEYNGNLILSIGDSDRLSVPYQFMYSGNYYGVQKITFDDGTEWTAANLAARVALPPLGTAPVIDISSGAADTIMLPAASGSNLTTSDSLNFTDDDHGDVHNVSVVNVTYSSSSYAALPDPTEMLGYLSASVATEPDTNPGTINWSFAAPSDAFSALAPGDSVDMTFTLQLRDQNNAVTSQDVVVSIISPASESMQADRGSAIESLSRSQDVSDNNAFYDDIFDSFISEVGWHTQLRSMASFKSRGYVPRLALDRTISGRVAPFASGPQAGHVAIAGPANVRDPLISNQADGLAQSIAAFGAINVGDITSFGEPREQDWMFAVKLHSVGDFQGNNSLTR